MTPVHTYTRALRLILRVASRRVTRQNVVSNVTPSFSHHAQVTLQYVQVYLDAAYDLLATSARDAAKPLEVHEDPHTGEVSAVGARTVEVTSLASAMRTLRDGERCVCFNFCTRRGQRE